MAENETVPTYDIKVGGAELAGPDKDKLQSIKVELRRQAPASVELQFNNDDGSYDDHAKLKPGAELVIKLGFEDSATSLVFTGMVVGTQVRLAGDAPRIFMVQAFDKMHKLSRGRNTKTFLESKFSDIVSGIGPNGGLTVDADDTSFVREYVIQHNQTDLEFIRGIAGWLDYDLRVDHTKTGAKLVFKKPDVSAAEILTAVYENPSQGQVHLRKFNGRQSLARVATETTVRGWDPKQKKEIVSKCSALDGKMGGTQSAVEAANALGSAPHHQLVDYKVFDQQEADMIAKTKLHEYARTFIRVDMELWGSPKVHAGGVIKVEGVGKRFDGPYFVEAVTHLFRSKVDVEGGYTTRLLATRYGW